MGFANVDGQKINVVLVIVVELSDVANLATKRWSSEAAEDQNKRPAGGSFADVKARGAIERNQAGIRSLIADFQITAAHVRQSVARHVQGVLRAPGHEA